MKPLFPTQQFQEAKSKSELPLECYHCSNTFFLTKHQIQACYNPNANRLGQFCNKTCRRRFECPPNIVPCSECGTTFAKKTNQIRKSKSGNHFCTKSCAATFNNKNKTHGTRRSKLEIYLEMKLTELYPDLDFKFNHKDAINSELDIYLPSLKLAFELNGIFHYEPIYGSDKLNQIQNNDNRKYQACFELGIELCIIDTSSQKYFKEHTAEKFLNIIITIINGRITQP